MMGTVGRKALRHNGFPGPIYLKWFTIVIQGFNRRMGLFLGVILTCNNLNEQTFPFTDSFQSISFKSVWWLNKTGFAIYSLRYVLHLFILKQKPRIIILHQSSVITSLPPAKSQRITSTVHLMLKKSPFIHPSLLRSKYTYVKDIEPTL